MWVRQGRTDAWIAHKLDVGVDELARFKREHDLEGGEEGTRAARPADPLSVPAPEPRAEEPDEEPESEDDVEDDADEGERPQRERSRSRSRSRRRPPRRRAPSDRDEDDEVEVEDEDDVLAPAADAGDEDRDGDATARRPRRRGRRGGRRHRARRPAYEATFDHGEEGYGLWLDPSVADNPVYSEHWAGHRAVTVTVEAEAITIRRAGAPRDSERDSGPDRESQEDPG